MLRLPNRAHSLPVNGMVNSDPRPMQRSASPSSAVPASMRSRTAGSRETHVAKIAPLTANTTPVATAALRRSRGEADRSRGGDVTAGA